MFFRGYPSHRYIVKSPKDQTAHANSPMPTRPCLLTHANSFKCYAHHFIDTSVATVKKKISKFLTILGELKKKI